MLTGTAHGIWQLGVIIQKNALRNQIKYFTNEGVMVIMK